MTNSATPDVFTITPAVDAAQEFIEIATDFSNPLDLVREAISNSFDAKAHTIRIAFSTIRQAGESVLVAEIEDDGEGMDVEGLTAFFDLGNSSRRTDPQAIGEKGHGTKVYFNSSEIFVRTWKNGLLHEARMPEPYKALHDRRVPEVAVKVTPAAEHKPGTLISIKGYNHNRRDKFTQDVLRDYVMWFTKFGSAEGEFGVTKHADARLFLKGLDVDSPQEVVFGHVFPEESPTVEKLFEKHLVQAPEHYCKKVIRQGKLKNFPEIKFQAVFCIEGNKVKHSYNPMLKRTGYTKGVYKVQDRYGLWLCKDFIPVQTANDWFGSRGTEYIKFHAFLNCQDLRLTANRGSINNTPSEILEDLRIAVQEIYDQITIGEEWRQMEWLESEVDAHRNTEREKRDFQDRKKRFNRSTIGSYQGHTINEPSHESAVFGLVVKLATIDPAIFSFEILDYNTHQGFDLLVKGDHTTPIHQSKTFYVELKWVLGNQLNHSFENLKGIVCWRTGVKHGGHVTDINGEARELIVNAPQEPGDVTTYYLDSPRRASKIEVIVLEHLLKEKCGVEFRARTIQETV
jgi:hypothetical protein